MQLLCLFPVGLQIILRPRIVPIKGRSGDPRVEGGLVRVIQGQLHPEFSDGGRHIEPGPAQIVGPLPFPALLAALGPRAVQAIHGLPALKFLALQMEPGDLRRHNVHLVGHIADGALQGTDAAFKQRRAVLGDTEGAQRLPLQDPAVLPYAQQSVLLIQKQGTVPLVGAEAVCGLERRLQSLILLKRGGVRLRFC